MASTKVNQGKKGFLLTDCSIVNINGQRATLKVDPITGSIHVIPLDQDKTLHDGRDPDAESSTRCLQQLDGQKALPGISLMQADCGIVDTALLTDGVTSACPPNNEPGITLTNTTDFNGAVLHDHCQNNEPHAMSGSLSDPNLGTANQEAIIEQDHAEGSLTKFRPEDGDLTPLRGVEQHLEREVLEQDLLEQFLSCVPHDFPFNSSSSTVAPEPPSSTCIEPGLFLASGCAAKGSVTTSITSTVLDHALKGQSVSSYAFFADVDLKSVDQSLTLEEHVTNITHTDSIPIVQTEVGRVSAFADWTFQDSNKLELYETLTHHRPAPLHVTPQTKSDATEVFHMKSNAKGADVSMNGVKRRGRKPMVRVVRSITKLKPLRPKPSAEARLVFSMPSARSNISLLPIPPVQTLTVLSTHNNNEPLHTYSDHMAQKKPTRLENPTSIVPAMQQPNLVLVADVVPTVMAENNRAVLLNASNAAHSNNSAVLRASDTVVGDGYSDLRVNDAAVRANSSAVIVSSNESAMGVTNPAVEVSNPAVLVSNLAVIVNNPAVKVSDSSAGVGDLALAGSNCTLKGSNPMETSAVTTTCPACDLTVPTSDLKSHLLTHRTVCGVCEAVFEMEEQLFEHLTRHSIRVIVDSDGSTELQCSICGAQFLHAGNVQRHVLSHSEPPGLPLMLAQGKCATNGQVLHSKGTAPHPKKAICHKCGKLLGTKSLVVHIKSHCPADDPDRHTNPMQCNECKNLFRNLMTLKRHLASCRRRMAGNSMEDVVTCDACFKSVSIHSLATHKRLYCAAAEPDSQTCIHCGTVLKHKHSLRNHIKWHCKKSPHATSPTKCTCGKVFRNYKCFQSHYQNHCLVRGHADV